jgi:RNA-directed DNA polymerase
MKVELEKVLEIKQKFSLIESKRDFADYFNFCHRTLYGDKKKPINLKQLTYFADSEKCINRYISFDVPKKSGGFRHINTPVEGLKNILKVLNVILQCIYEPNKYANGFVLNKSIVTNAQLHIKKHYVYNIDLKDFFHSFDRNRVKMTLIKELFNFNGEKEKIAFLIASLCTHPLLIEDGSTKIVLPQGSPTSPTLTNILCITLDRRLNGLAKKFGADYSRYADDITFSSQHNIFENVSFQRELKRIIEVDQSLVINNKKTRLQKTGFRKEVTGLNVNEKVNVQKRWIKQIRMWLYYWERYGYPRAQHIFSNDYRKDKSYKMIYQPELLNVLKGKIDFIKMVKGEQDSTYVKLKSRLENLTSPNKKSIKENHIERVLRLVINEGLNSGMTEYRNLKNDE